MNNRHGILEIRVTRSTSIPSVIKAFRVATGHPVADILVAINEKAPLGVARLYGNDHDDAEKRSLTLLNELDAINVQYEIILNGAVESIEYFRNVLGRWRAIGVETEMMSDLESGEPCVETLEWLKCKSPNEVYRKTLQQILSRDGYNVDSVTLQWVQRELITMDNEIG